MLVTGHSGFKGSWLTLWLKLLGSEVCGFALAPETAPNLFSSAAVADGIDSVFADIRDCDALMSVAQRFRPGIIIHNAAQALVRRSYREPVATYAINVMGTAHVLEAARLTPSVRAVVIVTSDKCYENREDSIAFCEEDPMGGSDPYSSSKGAAELVTAAYRQSFFSDGKCAVASARAGNVIGGGDWSADRLVPDVVRGIHEGRPILIRRPDSLRPWQHVLEPLRGYLMLGKLLCEHGQEYAEAWNFGPDEQDSITVGDLANRLVVAWGKGCLEVGLDAEAPHEAKHLRLDSRKAAEHLKWRPRLDLVQAVKWTVAWYRAFYEDPGNARQLTERQIVDYALSERS